MSDEVYIGAKFVSRPVPLEVEQEARPVSGKAVPVVVVDGEREGVVDADQIGDVAVEFFAEPFGETPARPEPLWRIWK